MLPSGLVAALAPGTVIGGKYRVERPLGVGGMGAVVAARHLDLNQALAIKVLLPSAAKSAEATTRFLREGRSAARLTSPHVAKVHDTGRLPTGEPYLVMELLHGNDLRALLAEVGRVPLAQAVDWVLQAAHALAEAHSLNIIHRDVKPANLFIAETTTGPILKVLDFGISKQLDSTEADLTKTSAAVGTPRYMAPEQMRSPKFADVRGDVWSLGIVLYELTTGQQPFQGESVTALCFDVMERTPARPSEINPALPPAFDAVIDLCLKKDPNERFQSVEALATALRAIVPGARASGNFNAAALQSATPVAGTTPLPSISSPNAAPPPISRTFPLPPLQSPETQETMRSWNTSALRRSVPKKPSRIPLVAVGIGIGFAIATPAVLLLTRRESSSPKTATSTLVSTLPVPSMSIAPVESAVTAPAPPLVSSPVESSPPIVESSPPPELAEPAEPRTSAIPVKPPRANCSPPYTLDEKGHRHAKPQCL